MASNRDALGFSRDSAGLGFGRDMAWLGKVWQNPARHGKTRPKATDLIPKVGRLFLACKILRAAACAADGASCRGLIGRAGGLVPLSG
jgi:hypothetical protein